MLDMVKTSCLLLFCVVLAGRARGVAFGDGESSGFAEVLNLVLGG
jgi:hypothetical protein